MLKLRLIDSVMMIWPGLSYIGEDAGAGFGLRCCCAPSVVWSFYWSSPFNWLPLLLPPVFLSLLLLFISLCPSVCSCRALSLRLIGCWITQGIAVIGSWEPTVAAWQQEHRTTNYWGECVLQCVCCCRQMMWRSCRSQRSSEKISSHRWGKHTHSSGFESGSDTF